MIAIHRPDDKGRDGLRHLNVNIHPDMTAKLKELASESDLNLSSYMAAIFNEAISERNMYSRVVASAANSYAPERGRKAKVFICHASEDKEIAREIYQELLSRHVDPWLDEEKLIPGEAWDETIQVVIQESDAILVLLSRYTVNKKGYVQKEIRKALEVADFMPEGRIYVIPVLVDDTKLPSKLTKWQAIDYGHESFYERLLRGIQAALDKA